MEIVPLTKENVDEAIALVTRVFIDSPKEDIALAFKASLGDGWDQAVAKWKLDNLVYYVGMHDGKLIGTVGYYAHSYDPEAYWLGWMCLDPHHRGKGYGKQLLHYVLAIACNAGKKKMRLYTSTDPAEAIANMMYDTMGFTEFKRKPYPDNDDYECVYKELIL